MNVLFLCTGNSARSILGEVIFNVLFSVHGRAYSAGSKPMGKVNPFALTASSREANRLEGLKGNRAGQYSIRINQQWRICFEWVRH